MFFGTSILKAFWIGFGRVLGGQNPRFSHFLQCFFDVIFEARFEKAKSSLKNAQKTEKAKFWSWAPVGGSLLGREKERGCKICAKISELRC